MSDSDDTDVLLLIPPNFLLIDGNSSEKLDSRSGKSTPKLPFMSSPSELESINARLAQIEREFPASSDISSISHCTVQTRDDQRCRGTMPFRSKSPRDFVHSTPKCDDNFNPGGNCNGVLQEIDTFLNKKSQDYTNPYRSSLGTTVRLSEWEKQQPSEKEPLISLSEIWGKDDNVHHVTLAEETLRRKHCERTIQALQAKLLEYQQKIAVAIEVDKKKDDLIQKHLEENLNLKSQFQKISSDIKNFEARQLDRIQELESENSALKSQKEVLNKDMASFRHLISDLEDKNQVLEVKLSQLMRASNETADIYKKQIADLEVRISNGHNSRGQLEEQLAALKSKLIEAEAASAKAAKDRDLNAHQLELCQEEVKLLQQQKRDAIEKYRDEKCRADTLYNEKKLLDDNLQELRRKETNVLKELESQRISLKSYYQQQLEQVVSQKLAEFQTQLDAVEGNVRTEAKEREKLLAERAIKQIEMINTKNEQEIELLQEKHREEVELYRIQLSNATKTIEELQEKLDAFRSKRADIASKLHTIMESQWQKALEVLTSPNSVEKQNDLTADRVNQTKVDGVELSTTARHDNPENESFETPTSSRNRKLRDKRTEERLQAYIQLLLNKSPRDLDNLDELLRVTKLPTESTHQDSYKNETSSHKVRRDQKPPWK